MNMTPCTVARHFLNDVWNQGNLSAIDALIDAHYIEHQRAPGMTPDREGLRRTIAGVRAALPDLRFTIEDALAEEDRVALRWRMVGTHTGSMAGIPATGQTIELSGIRIFRIVEGKIVEGWNEFDRTALKTMMQGASDPQVGLVRGLYDAFLRGDIAFIIEAMAEDVCWVNPVVRAITGTATYQGKDGVLAFFQALGEGTTLRAFEVRSVQSDADGVVATGIWQAIVSATGKLASTEWLMRWKIAEGRVAFYQAIVDTAQVDAAFSA